MSVYQLKDGRWIVQYRIKGTNRYNRQYFGRGLEAEQAATRANDVATLLPANKTLNKRRVPLEARAASKLVSCLNGFYGPNAVKEEVTIRDGRIDILTPDEIIEVKNVRRWKDGLGQLLVYGKTITDKHLRLHLFGKALVRQMAQIESTCSDFNVCVSRDGSKNLIPGHIRDLIGKRTKNKAKSKNVHHLRAAIDLIPTIEVPR